MNLYEMAMYCYVQACRVMFNTSMAYWCLYLQLQTAREEFE